MSEQAVRARRSILDLAASGTAQITDLTRQVAREERRDIEKVHADVMELVSDGVLDYRADGRVILSVYTTTEETR